MHLKHKTFRAAGELRLTTVLVPPVRMQRSFDPGKDAFHRVHKVHQVHPVHLHSFRAKSPVPPEPQLATKRPAIPSPLPKGPGFRDRTSRGASVPSPLPKGRGPGRGVRLCLRLHERKPRQTVGAFSPRPAVRETAHLNPVRTRSTASTKSTKSIPSISIHSGRSHPFTPEPRFARNLPSLPPLPFRRGEGRGKGSAVALGFRGANRVKLSGILSPALPRLVLTST